MTSVAFSLSSLAVGPLSGLLFAVAARLVVRTAPRAADVLRLAALLGLAPVVSCLTLALTERRRAGARLRFVDGHTVLTLRGGEVAHWEPRLDGRWHLVLRARGEDRVLWSYASEEALWLVARGATRALLP